MLLVFSYEGRKSLVNMRINTNNNDNNHNSNFHGLSITLQQAIF